MVTLRRALAFVLATSAAPAFACREPAHDDASVQPSTASSPAAAPAVALAASSSKANDARTTPGSDTAEAGAAAIPAPAGFGPANLVALDAGAREHLLAGDADPPIPVDTHYVQSNETRHDLFAEFVTGKGGAYVGVGSDQNYTMMATARAELAFLLDIDYRVVDLHRVYEVLIPLHEDPRSLVDAWHSRNEAATKAVLADAFAGLDPRERKRLLSGFLTARETVYRHLERVIARQRDGKPTTWLSDADNYAHVRAMYQTGRVRMMTGNLAGEVSLQTVAAACNALGEKVTVLYMSNAEEYFKYIAPFVASMTALPIDDEQSVVLRTIYSKKWVHADLWAYQVQPLADFRTRLADKKNRSRAPMLRYAEIDGSLDKQTGAEGLTLVALTRP
jgi:hypothetical protein